MDVEDNIVEKGSNITIDVRDEFIQWKTKRGLRSRSSFIKNLERDDSDCDRKKGPFLFTLAGQKTEFGPNEYYLYAAFNRVPLGRFHNGTGLCRVRITFKRKQGMSVARQCF
jgi:hypothetical protein